MHKHMEGQETDNDEFEKCWKEELERLDPEKTTSEVWDAHVEHGSCRFHEHDTVECWSEM
jgi:hypothetical protein